MDYRKTEEHSLALHREIARRLRVNPKHLKTVRKRLANDVGSGRNKKSVASPNPHRNPSQDGGHHNRAPENILAGSSPISSRPTLNGACKKLSAVRDARQRSG
jgi:hypothetical protein